MYVERLIYPIESLGPGKRIALWLQGCTHRCPFCASPELWDTKESHYIDARVFAHAVAQQFDWKVVDGLTVTGGDPMLQFDELMIFLQEVRSWIPDILVYTGFTLEQLETNLSTGKLAMAKSLVDVLIDGPYIHTLNDNHVSLRGSTNQLIHYWNPAHKKRYEEWMKTNGRPVQNVFIRESLISVGIHNKEEERKNGPIAEMD